MAGFDHHVLGSSLLQSGSVEVGGVKISGGLLLFENSQKEGPRMLVAHPGGPFFKNRDNGWWSIPKGEPEDGEEIFHAALREFEEETGLPPQGPFIDVQVGYRHACALHQEDDLERLVRAEAKPGDIVVCLGAGTISAWANNLPARLQKTG